MRIVDIADRASGYGMPGAVVDGNDVLAVYATARKAVERARKREGPTLIECKTYRHKGHSRVDPAKYRVKEEVQEWLEKDPIKRLMDMIVSEHVLSNDEIEKIETAAMAEVEKAVKFAIESPYPAPEEALEDVYG
jgi:pyruvate dehydrogenase E1 component alpha subunit